MPASLAALQRSRQIAATSSFRAGVIAGEMEPIRALKDGFPSQRSDLEASAMEEPARS